MRRIEELFNVHRACSDLFEEYEAGSVAYVSNSSDANGVVGFVEPLEGDAVFRFTGIVVNSFSRTPFSCGARVQVPPFIACGRSGNGLLVLEPKKAMTTHQLATTAAYINRAHGWRMTWYRQATKDRLSGLLIPEHGVETPFPVKELLPKRTNEVASELPKMSFKAVSLDSLFGLEPGTYHAESELDEGNVPLVSCGDENNGVLGHYDLPPENVHRNRLTVAFNGRPLTTKYHPYQFAAKDDVAIAVPCNALRLTTLLFIKMMLNRDRWHYSYYRKCYMDKLRRYEVKLPWSGNALDEEAMKKVIESHPYWGYMKERLSVSG